jgi:hypothetical protein
VEKRKLAEIEEYILELFRGERSTRLPTRRVFESTSRYANADLVRAFEDMEKKWRLLVRFTEEGNDWVQLTPAGAEHAQLNDLADADPPPAHPHPPKSST